MKKLVLFLCLICFMSIQASALTRYSSKYISLSDVTTASNGTAVNIANVESFSVYWDVVTTGSTANAVCVVQASPDGSTWYTVDSQTKTTGGATLRHVVASSALLAKYVRAIVTNVVRATTTATIVIGSNR